MLIRKENNVTFKQTQHGLRRDNLESTLGVTLGDPPLKILGYAPANTSMPT